MEEQLINLEQSVLTAKCFLAKQMTYLESRDFIQNEQHLRQCLDCRQKLLSFELKKKELLNDFQSFAANLEVSEILSKELEEIIPEFLDDEEMKGKPTLKKRPYQLSLKDFFIYLVFGLSRRTQFVIVSLIALAACIY